MAIKSGQHQKHVYLIIAFAVVVSGLSAVAANYSNGELSRALTSRVIYFQPGSNGLAHISSQKPDTKINKSIENAGNSVGTSIILESTASED